MEQDFQETRNLGIMSSHAGSSQWQRMQSLRDSSNDGFGFSQHQHQHQHQHSQHHYNSSSLSSQARPNSVSGGDAGAQNNSNSTSTMVLAEAEKSQDDEAQEAKMQAFRERFQKSEKYIDRLFRSKRPCCRSGFDDGNDDGDFGMVDFGDGMDSDGDGVDAIQAKPALPAPTRRIVEDDYDDDEDDEPPPKKQAVSAKSSAGLLDIPKAIVPHHTEAKKSPAATREKLEDDRKAAEEAAKRALSNMFFTLETDRDAMLEQQKLEESDRQVNAEHNGPGGEGVGGVQGKLSSVNLGASSLTLKHLITRIDAQRERVELSDMELRSLISEVRKNRSKWASEDKIGQEELYEAAEKVTIELRAYTEHSTAFLNRVNKREVPDYFTGRWARCEYISKPGCLKHSWFFPVDGRGHGSANFCGVQ